MNKAMSNLLREYIKSILSTQQLYEASAEKSKNLDLTLLSNKNLGYAAEWAVYKSIAGTESLFAGGTPIDSRLIGPWEATDKKSKARKIFMDVYQSMIDSASTALDNSPAFKKPIKKPSAVSKKGKVYPPPGGSGRPVDVVSDTADIHVKYNDAARLAGFQREKTEKEETIDPVTKKKIINKIVIPSSATADAFDASMKKFISDARNMFDAETFAILADYVGEDGLLRKPSSLSSKGSGKEWETAWLNFTAAKEAYQEIVQRADRANLLAILSKNGIKKAILNDIDIQLFGGSMTTSQTVFAKFYAQKFESETDIAKFNLKEYKSSITCDFLDYKQLTGLSKPIDQLEVFAVADSGFERAAETAQLTSAIIKPARKKFNVAGQSTVFYLVKGKGKFSENLYFKIEFRLDGEGHPPQLKVGPDLDQL